MHYYLMTVWHFFRGEQTFEIVAENKKHAIELGKKLVCESPEYSFGGNYDKASVKVVKKLKKKYKEEDE